MLLRQLVDYRPTEPGSDDAPTRPYSRERTVRWQLTLDPSGRPLGLVDLADPSQQATKRGLPKTVPHAGRTVGIAPVLGADDVQYVLGWCDDKSKPPRVAKAHAAFAELCRRWAREYPDDALAQTVAGFYGQPVPDAAVLAKGQAWSSKDLVTIAVGSRPVTDSDALWQLWATVVEERKSGGGTGGGSDAKQGLCLVCGTTGPLLNRMPQALPKALVPRAEQEIALVSANKAIHTYDFSQGLGTTPICVHCGQAAVANLHTILSNREHTFTYERQRTRLAWWVTAGGDAATIELLDQSPDKISDYLERLHTGKRPRALGEHQLCAVTVSGNVARLVVHDWLEQPLKQAEDSVLGWFDDHEIASIWEDRPARFPIWRLVTCAGQWQPGASQEGGAPAKGRYVPLYDKAADRPDDLAQLLLRSALHGAHLPPYALAHLIRRIRTDQHLDESRVALLRVALVRHPNPTVEAPMPGLNPDNTHPAYVCGRLFAMLEAAQRAAYPREEQPNTTFFDQYFAGAVANPHIAAVQGSQMRAAWMRKIRTSADREHSPEARSKRLATVTAIEAHLDALFECLDDQPLPARIGTEEQSLFVVGYHHQRAHDRAQARASRSPESEFGSDPGPSTSLPKTPEA
ncbi:MAG: hypothetical protein HKP61_11300 [Dactylosporangium sp.]|nr:type I-C CRISPR-associated protein Cas8c/Csd1 [Dactylosporangium sp.]NNJ61512.1 hypothetical protein [Dactylosporangium sp.]